jgi:hypothetical protein
LHETQKVPAFDSGESYTDTLNALDLTPGVDGAGYRNVGYTNNGLQITYNPTYDSVTVDQLLDTAKLFKSAMEVMIATEMSEGTLENILSCIRSAGKATSTEDGDNDVLGLEAGALGAAPTERQLIAVGQAPTVVSPNDRACILCTSCSCLYNSHSSLWLVQLQQHSQ